jgi:hypothetical protein
MEQAVKPNLAWFIIIMIIITAIIWPIQDSNWVPPKLMPGLLLIELTSSINAREIENLFKI